MNCIIRERSGSQSGVATVMKDFLMVQSSNKEILMRIESPDTSILHQGDKVVYLDNRTGISVETSICDTIPVECAGGSAFDRILYFPRGICAYTCEVPGACFAIPE